MTFYKNIKLEKITEDEYHLTIRVSEVLSQVVVLRPEQLEHIISSYRNVK